MAKRPLVISRIRGAETKFSLSDIPLSRFVVLGKQHKDTATMHVAYLRKPSIGSECLVQPAIKVSGYCSYSLVTCQNTGLLGVVFYTYNNKTFVDSNVMTIERNIYLDDVQAEVFTPLFTLERLDLLLYPSDCGSLVVIPTILLDTSLVVQAS